MAQARVERTTPAGMGNYLPPGLNLPTWTGCPEFGWRATKESGTEIPIAPLLYQIGTFRATFMGFRAEKCTFNNPPLFLVFFLFAPLLYQIRTIRAVFMDFRPRKYNFRTNPSDTPPRRHQPTTFLVHNIKLLACTHAATIQDLSIGSGVRSKTRLLKEYTAPSRSMPYW
ncbi:hypothetical protein B0H17DRAFT_1134026 [Mycena rosella]|uniref:Uncharacterized protein n=1 Tax=Mycena rosella TaxID=1033263 RepID=A0AAD7DGY2_MYCRO|nr:hypothetical protein B0H17DRAFT_1134026 [Mycena rosella]